MTTQTQQVATKEQVSPLALLKKNLYADSVQKQFRNAMGEHSDTFCASIIELYNTDDTLKTCDPNQVIMECLKAATLHLPINRALGQAYILPFNKKVVVYDQQGVRREKKVPVPTFIIGYRGYIQLALRTGKYKNINVGIVYEGEYRNTNKLTGEYDFSGERTSDTIVGYFAYIELLNGFSKTLYMTKDQMVKHAKRHGKGIKSDVTLERLATIADIPEDQAVGMGWMGDFQSMAKKTVLRRILDKWGYVSTEMAAAFARDDAEQQPAPQTEQQPATTIIDADAVVYEDVSSPKASAATPPPAPAAPDCGY